MWQQKTSPLVTVTEIMVALKQGPTYAKEFDYEEFRNYLNDLGDSLLVVNDERNR